MADLLGVAAVIGSSATFLGTAGAIWLQATGKDRNRNTNEQRPVNDLNDDELADLLAQRIAESNNKGKHRKGKTLEFRRFRPWMT